MNLIEKIKSKEFKNIKKFLREKGLTSKYVKNLLEPYMTSDTLIKYLKEETKRHNLIKEINVNNKTFSDIFIQNLEGDLIYDTDNWNKNIYKYDILIPEKIFETIENLFYNSKINDPAIYNFIAVHRNGIYCIIYRIYQFWFYIKNMDRIELDKLYHPEHDIKQKFVRISKEEFRKFSENYIDILAFLEELNIISIDNYYKRPIINNGSIQKGICKGFRINDGFNNLCDEKLNKLIVVRINNKKCCKYLYYDYISCKEFMNYAKEDDIKSFYDDDYLKNFTSRPKRIGISNNCKYLLERIEDSLTVSSVDSVYEYLESNYNKINAAGLSRGKNNITDKCHNYLNFFNLKYNSDSDGNKLRNFTSFLDRTGRFYTFFNTCPKELIFQLFKLKSKSGNIEPLVEVDMRSCHFNMLALLFNKNVLKNGSIQNFVGPDLLYWLDTKIPNIPEEQLRAFKNLCSSPNYYEKMAELINEKSEKKYDVNDIKKLNMYFLYNNNISNPIDSIFKLYFPFIIEFLHEVKKTYQSLSKLSYLLMRLESYFFIDKGIQKMNEEGITVLPKHDCYYVAESDAKRVRSILTSIYFELTEGDADYSPSYDREVTRIKSLFSNQSIDSKISFRDTQLKKYISKTREEKAKINLYINLYYKEFNDFLTDCGIKNFKANKNLSSVKLKKIEDRLIKMEANQEIYTQFEALTQARINKSYEEYILKSKKYNKLILKELMVQYLYADFKDKVINQPIFLNKQKVSEIKIQTPYEFYLTKTKNSKLKERQNTQNMILY